MTAAYTPSEILLGCVVGYLDREHEKRCIQNHLVWYARLFQAGLVQSLA